MAESEAEEAYTCEWTRRWCRGEWCAVTVEGRAAWTTVRMCVRVRGFRTVPGMWPVRAERVIPIECSGSGGIRATRYAIQLSIETTSRSTGLGTARTAAARAACEDRVVVAWRRRAVPILSCGGGRNAMPMDETGNCPAVARGPSPRRGTLKCTADGNDCRLRLTAQHS